MCSDAEAVGPGPDKQTLGYNANWISSDNVSVLVAGRTKKGPPAWARSVHSGMGVFWRDHVRREITPKRVILGLILFPFAFYFCQELFRDAVIIEPFSVPKKYEEKSASRRRGIRGARLDRDPRRAAGKRGSTARG